MDQLFQDLSPLPDASLWFRRCGPFQRPRPETELLLG
jgi:hypothetical protein